MEFRDLQCVLVEGAVGGREIKNLPNRQVIHLVTMFASLAMRRSKDGSDEFSAAQIRC